MINIIIISTRVKINFVKKKLHLSMTQAFTFQIFKLSGVIAFNKVIFTVYHSFYCICFIMMFIITATKINMRMK